MQAIATGRDRLSHAEGVARFAVGWNRRRVTILKQIVADTECGKCWRSEVAADQAGADFRNGSIK
jgi:hypothetical protein